MTRFPQLRRVLMILVVAMHLCMVAAFLCLARGFDMWAGAFALGSIFIMMDTFGLMGVVPQKPPTQASSGLAEHLSWVAWCAIMGWVAVQPELTQFEHRVFHEQTLWNGWLIGAVALLIARQMITRLKAVKDLSDEAIFRWLVTDA